VKVGQQLSGKGNKNMSNLGKKRSSVQIKHWYTKEVRQ